MAAVTIAQMLAAGVPAGLADKPSSPGYVVIDYLLDGSKKAIGSTDTVEFYQVPTNASLIVQAASVQVITAATATANFDLGIWVSSATDITGLTAFDLDVAAVHTHKAATAANVAVSGSKLIATMDTATLGGGVIRIRVFGILAHAG